VKRKEECRKLQVANEANDAKVKSLVEEMKNLKEELRSEIEERKTTEIGVGVLAEKVATDREKQNEEHKRTEQQMDEVEVRKVELGEMLRKMAEKDMKVVEERSEEAQRLTQLELKLMKQLEDLRGKVEEWKNGEKNDEMVDLTANRDKSVTTAKGVVDPSDSMWEGAVNNGDEYT
jgi:hypothetical protein